jgi:hypothetical protein
MIDCLRSSLRFVLTSFSIDQTGEMAHRWVLRRKIIGYLKNG